MKEKQPSYQDIINLVTDLKKDVKRLTDENNALKNRIHELEHPKNSNNSSIPPSKDENRPKRNQSLREKTGRKTGGQPGHKGHSLKRSNSPDSIITHAPEICFGCGADISEVIPFSIRKRQVVDIPPVKPVYTEHRCHSKQCSCGHVTAGTFPKNVKTPIQYGQNIEHLVAYLSVGQYLPYQRITSLLEHILGLSLSEGTIKNMLERFAKRLEPTYQKIRKDIELALTVGADETGAKTDGKKWWFWTWQNSDATYIAASGNRAFSTVQEHFPDGFKYATLISDRYSAHLKQSLMPISYV